MEFRIKGPFNNNLYNLMRSIGYHYLKTVSQTREISFTKSLAGSAFPRYHLFIKEVKETNEMLFDLHLDQKAPSYGGTAAHSGEYSGELINKEAERIRKNLGTSAIIN